MIKRLTTMLIALIIAFSYIGNISLADNVNVPEDIKNISSKYVALYEANSGSFLYEKSGTQMAYPASTTKVLTAIIVLDLCEGNFLLGDIYEYFESQGDSWNIPEGYHNRTFTLDETVTVTSVETKGSTLIPHITEGEKMNLKDMLYGMMLVSGNDCARALARHFSPDNELGGFAKLMNAYCKELGAMDSTFNVPHGLHIIDKFNETTACDMAVITAYALKNETFRKIVATETYTIPRTNTNGERVLENTNRLIHKKEDDTESYLYEYAIGVKTGDTDAAGRCIIAAAEKNEMTLIAVLLGDYESSRIGSPRYINSKLLFEYGFNNFTLVNADDFDFVKTIEYNIVDADLATTKLSPKLTGSSLCIENTEYNDYKQNAESFTYKVNIDTKDGILHAPLKAGDVVGTIEYSYKDRVILKTDLVAAFDVTKTDGRAKTGATKVEENEKELTGYDWIFWVALACLLFIIIIVLIALTKQPVRRRNSQLRRKSRR